MEGLYYPSSENKGADQLRYREADLRLYFRNAKSQVSLDAAKINVMTTCTSFRSKAIQYN